MERRKMKVNPEVIYWRYQYEHMALKIDRLIDRINK